MTRLLAVARAWALAVALGCGKASQAGSGDGSSASGADEVAASGAGEASAPMDARESAQWTAGRQGDPEELMRLEDLVGCEGLVERAARQELRETAIRAMQYCPDFSELPWLARWATEGTTAEARAALETIDELAARPRRATDPEDAEELHEGCAALLDLARAQSRPRERRVLAVRALRMLADRGCVRPADIPADLGAR
jgi:hypothetical protein